MVRRLGLLYDRWLHQAPLLTKALTSAALFGLGDRIAQRVEAHAKSDEGSPADQHPATDRDATDGALVSASTARTLRMMVWGGCFLAPTLHKWFAFVDRVIPGVGATVVAKKIALDMFFFAPQISLAFFVTTKCMEGRPASEAVDVGLERLPATLQANYSVWPFANIVAFSVVPIHYRILFNNCVGLYWSSFLSRMASSRARIDPADADGELTA